MTGAVIVYFAMSLCLPAACWSQEKSKLPGTLSGIETMLETLRPDPAHPHDRYGLVALKEAVAAMKEGNGGIGACLVRKSDGNILEVGRNRQHAPFFRSDLHAEMDLLNRYEEKKKALRCSGCNPREIYEDVILFSSVEPCPMCLTRIINSGIRTVYYLAPDRFGGMVAHMEALPKFWKNLAAGRTYEQAQCSPLLRDIALHLFYFFRKGGTKPPPGRMER